MRLTGMKYGAPILELAEFPIPEVLNADASIEEIEKLIAKRGKCVVKPVFYGGVGKKGKAGLVKIVSSASEALEAMKTLYFAEHTFNNERIQAHGVTFEEFIPSSYEIYFNFSVSTISRRVNFTLTHHGGVDIEDLDHSMIFEGSFDAITGLKSFHIIDALAEINAPAEVVSPLTQFLPKLWHLYNDFGFTMIEINPIRMENIKGKLVPIACDFKAQFDQDNPQYKRLNIPEEVFHTDLSDFEIEINQLRTYKGQSDVVVINPEGTITSFMFGGGANSAATEVLSDKTTISSDFGGNPPYEKMNEIASITYKYWIKQSNVLLIIGGKANNTDIYITFKGIFDALQQYVNKHGKPDIYVVVGRGGPNLIKGFSYAANILDKIGIPYKFFGYDSSMLEVIQYAVDMDDWMIERKKS